MILDEKPTIIKCRLCLSIINNFKEGDVECHRTCLDDFLSYRIVKPMNADLYEAIESVNIQSLRRTNVDALIFQIGNEHVPVTQELCERFGQMIVGWIENTPLKNIPCLIIGNDVNISGLYNNLDTRE